MSELLACAKRRSLRLPRLRSDSPGNDRLHQIREVSLSGLSITLSRTAIRCTRIMHSCNITEHGFSVNMITCPQRFFPDHPPSSEAMRAAQLRPRFDKRCCSKICDLQGPARCCPLNLWARVSSARHHQPRPSLPSLKPTDFSISSHTVVRKRHTLSSASSAIETRPRHSYRRTSSLTLSPASAFCRPTH